jgi:hypothetical protein
MVDNMDLLTITGSYQTLVFKVIADILGVSITCLLTTFVQYNDFVCE